MGYYYSDEPVPNTCPLIDKVVSFVESVPDEEGITTMDRLMGRCEKSNSLDLLEKIREANSELRSWGNENHRKAFDLDEELEELKSKYEELEDDLTRQLSQKDEEIKSLNQEIETLNN